MKVGDKVMIYKAGEWREGYEVVSVTPTLVTVEYVFFDSRCRAHTVQRNFHRHGIFCWNSYPCSDTVYCVKRAWHLWFAMIAHAVCWFVKL